METEQARRIREAEAKFPRPRGFERWMLRIRAWRRDRREARFNEIRRIAEGAHAADDNLAFEWCMRKLDRLGGKAWSDYLRSHHVDRDTYLVGTLNKLGVNPTPGQLRWIEASLPSSYRS
jgi:hypothetical protein